MTREHPIPFTGDMVRAILAGQKTQTRRVIKPQPMLGQHWKHGWIVDGETMDIPIAYSPYGIRGDRLWVRETLTIGHHSEAMVYLADGSRVFRDGNPMYYPQDWPWQRSVLPSIFMPRWACRLLLEVMEVRVERVKDITSRDCFAEGVRGRLPPFNKDSPADRQRIIAEFAGTMRWGFKALWDELNAKRGFGWKTNPWTWVVRFSIHDGERPR